MIILAILFVVLFLFLSLRRLDLAAMFLIAFLPAYLLRFKILGIPWTLLEAMILILFLVWFFINRGNIFDNLKTRLKNGVVLDYPFKWEMILLLIISFIAIGVGGFTSSGFGIWKAYFLEPVMLYIVVFNLLISTRKKEEDKNKFSGKINFNLILYPLFLSALAISLLAIYQKLTGQLIYNSLWSATETRRVVSFFGYPNAVGLFLGPLIMVFLGFLLSCRTRSGIQEEPVGINVSKTSDNLQSYCESTLDPGSGAGMTIKKIIIVFIIILSLSSIFFAKSIGASLGVLAGLFIFGLLAGRKSRIATLGILVAVLICTFSFAPLRATAVKYLTLNDFSGQVRMVGWSDTWRMLSDGRLIFGAGLANFQNAIKPYHTEGFFYNKDNDPDFHRKTVFNEAYRKAHWQPLEIYLYPHNIFLNFWSELGLAGMILFIWIIIKYFYLGIKSIINYQLSIINKFIIIGLIGAMTAVVVHGLVDVPYFKNDLSALFWIMMAMMSVIYANNTAKIHS